MNESVKDKFNILSFDFDELIGVVTSYGEKTFRAKQVFGWLAKGVGTFDEMRNVPAKLRDALDESYYIGLPELVVKQESADGTIKCLFEFADGARVESVFMKYSYGNSVCISSQVGCRMGCEFCASTRNGLERSLESGEMLAQILKLKEITAEDIGHVVVMGIGEPFDNYEELSRFLRIVHSPDGFNLGFRNITISTCGLVPMIKSFAEDFPQVNLAISLHAPNDVIRRKLMPIANKYSMGELIAACKEYTVKTGRRITYEYALIDGVNDSRKCAEELAGRLKGHIAHVNLIPLNSVSEAHLKSAKNENIREFCKVLETCGVAVTVRRTLGADIDAACGQLRLR